MGQISETIPPLAPLVDTPRYEKAVLLVQFVRSQDSIGCLGTVRVRTNTSRNSVERRGMRWSEWNKKLILFLIGSVNLSARKSL